LIARSLGILALLFMSTSSVAQACSLSLAYKDKGKPGYMAAAPSNDGLYQALYQELASNLGCDLIISRYPKKRTHRLLELGDIDLYPSTGFDNKRSEYLFYIPNGLFRYEAYFGLTPAFVDDLSSIEDIGRYDLSWIFEAGSTTSNKALALGVNTEPLFNLSDDRAIEMLKKGRKVFYRIIDGDYSKYLKKHKKKDLTDFGISTHTRCCEAKSHPLYTGFSRTSANYAEVPNPAYDSQFVISAENFPYRLSPKSLAYRVAAEMNRLRASGRVSALYDQYVVKPGHTP